MPPMSTGHQPRTVICPGSYDPVTNGHLDIIGRTSRVFDRVIVGVVGQGIRKSKTMFSAEERRDFLLDDDVAARERRGRDLHQAGRRLRARARRDA